MCHEGYLSLGKNEGKKLFLNAVHQELHFGVRQLTWNLTLEYQNIDNINNILLKNRFVSDENIWLKGLI